MKLIVQPSDGETGRQHDDVDNLHGNLGDANYEQADEHEYGDEDEQEFTGRERSFGHAV